MNTLSLCQTNITGMHGEGGTPCMTTGVSRTAEGHENPLHTIRMHGSIVSKYQANLWQCSWHVQVKIEGSGFLPVFALQALFQQAGRLQTFSQMLTCECWLPGPAGNACV